MRIILVLLLFMFSCKKEEKICFDCELTSISGQTEKRVICTDDGIVPQQRDANGVDMNARCKRR